MVEKNKMKDEITLERGYIPRDDTLYYFLTFKEEGNVVKIRLSHLELDDIRDLINEYRY